VLRQRVRFLFRQLPKALAGDEEAIHQMRVGDRRLRAALPLLARKPEGKRVRRALRRLRRLVRAAGRSRDIDVILGRLREHVQGVGKHLPEARVLVTRLTAARRRSRARMADELLDLDIARLRCDLRATERRGVATHAHVLARLAAAREDGGREALASVDACDRRFDPEALHALRRSCRRLRYVAEIADRLSGQPSQAPELFRQIQDGLGEVHDDWVLSGWLERQARAAAHRQTGLAQTAGTLAARFRAESRERHRALTSDGLRRRVAAALDAMRDL
jgi:CHAD domain-containing protein